MSTKDDAVALAIVRRDRDQLEEELREATDHNLDLSLERDALRAENQRLRTALRQIAEASDWHPADMQAFARAVAWQT